MSDDRRLSWEVVERDYSGIYENWKSMTIERAKERDFVVLRDDGRLDLTTDEGQHGENYWVWDRNLGRWRKALLEEIRGHVYDKT